MEIKSTYAGGKLGSNQLRKVALLITEASRLGMDVSGHGYADENQHSGYVYLWLEDYPFTLYIGLGSDTVYALWSSPYDGEEVETEVAGKTLTELEEWAQGLYEQDELKQD